MKKRIAYKIIRNYKREQVLTWHKVLESPQGEISIKHTVTPCQRYTKGQLQEAANKVRKCCRRRFLSSIRKYNQPFAKLMGL